MKTFKLTAVGSIKSTLAGIKAAKDSGISDTELLDLLSGMGIKVEQYVPVLERNKAA